MPATTIDGYSNELALSIPFAQAFSPAKPNQYTGRCRVAYFNRNCPGGGTLNYAMVELPAGARVLLINYVIDASTGGGPNRFGLMAKDASGFIDAAGLVSDNTQFFKTDGTQVAGEYRSPTTIALNIGYETEKACYLTYGTSVPASAHNIRGFVTYVTD